MRFQTKSGVKRFRLFFFSEVRGGYEYVIYAYVPITVEVVDAGIFRISELFAEMLGRSSRTSLVQIQKHNKAVERSGFCQACKRVESRYENMIAQKNMQQSPSA
jgi:hypothetical protein